ncbi:hypothetical protein ACVIWU_007345 [Bradyrhizobium sp. USDA 4509]|nr:hypothetical protein [Bradyrhizobium elkanii]
MGVSRRRRSKWRQPIPTRFALTSEATSPFQGEVLETDDAGSEPRISVSPIQKFTCNSKLRPIPATYGL